MAIYGESCGAQQISPSHLSPADGVAIRLSTSKRWPLLGPQVVMRQSSDKLIASLFAVQSAPTGRRRGGFRGVVLQFSAQLDELLRVVASSQVRNETQLDELPCLISS